MDIVVLDTETTGLKPAYEEIVEIGAVRIRENEIVGSFQSLVWPGEGFFLGGRAETALNIQGRTVDDLRGAPTTDEVTVMFREFLGGGGDLTAFNVGFDRSFLHKTIWLRNRDFSWPFCVMLKASWIMGEADSPYCPWNNFFGDYKWPKLWQAAEFFGVDFKEKDLHGALVDAKITASILLKMIGQGEFEKKDP